MAITVPDAGAILTPWRKSNHSGSAGCVEIAVLTVGECASATGYLPGVSIPARM